MFEFKYLLEQLYYVTLVEKGEKEMLFLIEIFSFSSIIRFNETMKLRINENGIKKE